MILNLHILTAAALVGVDLAAQDRNNVSSRPRVMRGVAVVGSVAVDDFWVDVFIGNHFVGRFYNTKIATNQIAINEDVRREIFRSKNRDKHYWLKGVHNV